MPIVHPWGGAMSWGILALVRDRQLPSDKKVSACNAKLLMLLLAEWVNSEGVAVYTRSKADFADVCQISERSVQRIFATLIKKRLVEIEVEAHAASKRPRTYRINVEELKKLPLTATAKAELERAQRKDAANRKHSEGDGTGDPGSPVGETGCRGTGDTMSRTGDLGSPIDTPTTPIETQSRARDPSPLGGEGPHASEPTQEDAGKRPWEVLGHARLVSAVAARRAEHGSTVRMAGITEAERQAADAYLDAVARGEITDTGGLAAPHACDIWRRHCERIEAECGEKVWRSWLVMLTPHADDGATLTLAAPSRFIAGMVERDHAAVIGQITNRKIVVEVHAYAGHAARERQRREASVAGVAA